MPAIAIADTIKENQKNAELLFVGACGGMEEQIVRDAGYEITCLRVKGLVRSLSLANISALVLMKHAIRDAKRLIEDFAPDIVIGTGGYACYAALSAACTLGVPCAVHESNAVPGLAVRRLASRVDRVWLNFEQTGKELHDADCLTVGNPLRHSGSDRAPTRLPPGCRQMVLSFGGSLGATEINRAVLELMWQYRNRPDVYFLHASGKREYEEVYAAFKERGLDECRHLEVLPFINDMQGRMASADVVISRAGAISIAELAAHGCAAILIPSPNVTGNHQYKNAEVLARSGAAILLQESELSQGGLAAHTAQLLNDRAKREALSKAICRFARPQANREIYLDILRLVEKREKK